MKCSSCGAELRSSAKLCIKCGHKVTDEERSAAIHPVYSSDEKTHTIDSVLDDVTFQGNDAASTTNEAPVFDIPAPPDVTPILASRGGQIFQKATVQNQIGNNKKLFQIGGGIACGIIAFGILYSVLKSDSKQTSVMQNMPAPTAVKSEPVQQIAPPQSVSEQTARQQNINSSNIKPVLAPAQTAQYLYQMILNYQDIPRLLELKAAIEGVFPKQSKGDVKAARLLNERGLTAFRMENFGEATSLFFEAIKVNPADIEIYNNLAYSLLKEERFQAAEKVLGDVLSYSPGRTSAWANLADLYSKTSRPDAAAAAFVVGFQFSNNREKSLNYLMNAAENDPSENVRAAAALAVKSLSQ